MTSCETWLLLQLLGAAWAAGGRRVCPQLSSRHACRGRRCFCGDRRVTGRVAKAIAACRQPQLSCSGRRRGFFDGRGCWVFSDSTELLCLLEVPDRNLSPQVGINHPAQRQPWPQPPQTWQWHFQSECKPPYKPKLQRHERHTIRFYFLRRCNTFYCMLSLTERFKQIAKTKVVILNVGTIASQNLSDAIFFFLSHQSTIQF